MRCSWLIPREEVTPKKNDILKTEDVGDYTVTGIFPEGVFWRVTATRKDSPHE